MVEVDGNALAFAVLVLTVGSFALMLKLMLLALALDDFYELKSSPATNPECMVARDEMIASIGRVLSVAVVVLIGLIWCLVSLGFLDREVIRVSVALGLVFIALVALLQGIRAMRHRRKLAQVLNRTRRPQGPRIYNEP